MNTCRQLCSFLVLTLAFMLCTPAMATDMLDEEFTYDIENDMVHIIKYTSIDIADIIVPDTIADCPVTSIGSRAFVTITMEGSAPGIAELKRSDIKSVVIPDTVVEIGNDAFWLNEGLRSITLPSELQAISDGLFSGCTALPSLSLPTSINSIGNKAFYECTSLESITIPASVQTIGTQTFYACESLADVELPGSNENQLTAIGPETFAHCRSLKSIEIPEGITQIGEYAFEDCTALVSITLPVSLRQIDTYAFMGCDSLKTIYYAGTPSQFGEIQINGTTTQDCALLGATIVYTTPSDPIKPGKLPHGITIVPDSPVTVENMNGINYLTGYTAARRAVCATADDLKAQFALEDGIEIAICSSDSTVKSNADILATGDTIHFMRDDENLFQATIIIRGDVLGQGAMSLTQLVRLAAAFNGTQPLTGPYLVAGDFTHTGSITLSDLVQEAQLLM